VVDALRLMQDKRVRAILVLEGDQLLGIVTQGDCAIKVLLPGLDCKEVAVKDVMTAQPVTVKLDDPMEACTGLMAARNFRHLPVLEQGKVVGVVSVGDVIKQNIREMEQQIGFLETYIKGHGG
jgi:CBS domain-containing protein